MSAHSEHRRLRVSIMGCDGCQRDFDAEQEEGMTDLFFVLDPDHRPVPAPDVRAWGRWFEDIDNRRVAQTQVGPYSVSTVFLGTDHGFGGPSLWFETMVFGPKGRQSSAQWRYATWDEAVKGHEAAVMVLRSE